MTKPPPPTPQLRVTAVNSQAIRKDGDFVLYWMIAFRRTQWNFALQRAVWHAQQLQKPLLILEALRTDYPWASDRFHHFVIAGMRDNQASCQQHGVSYYAYVEPEIGHGKELLSALGEHACVVVTDEFPCFFLPRMVARAGQKLSVLLEQVDSNGLLPLRASDRAYPTAYAFRRYLQKTLPAHLEDFPCAEPLKYLSKKAKAQVPLSIVNRWLKPLDFAQPESVQDILDQLPINHNIEPVMSEPGGAKAAQKRASVFVQRHLQNYGEDRNHPDRSGSSGLSAYLHFGHLSIHQVVTQIFTHEDWNPGQLAEKASGSREGYWGLSPSAEAFMDEAITWRELGYVFCFHRSEDYDRYESLPEWAQTTLAQHAKDPRPHLYSFDELDQAQTQDRLWNAAQTQLVSEGRIHNYLRMLWGKKILEWSPSPHAALDMLIELNNRYALDGRNPNSYSGIFWIFGRFDRAWGPERAIFGKIRYMSSQNTMRKVDVADYLNRYAPKLGPRLSMADLDSKSNGKV